MNLKKSACHEKFIASGLFFRARRGNPKRTFRDRRFPKINTPPETLRGKCFRRPPRFPPRSWLGAYPRSILRSRVRGQRPLLDFVTDRPEKNARIDAAGVRPECRFLCRALETLSRFQLWPPKGRFVRRTAYI